MTGEEIKLCVIGHPITHSLSPKIHNQFAADLQLSCSYEAFDVLPETLNEFIHMAKNQGILGFNLTMPLKETILPQLSMMDEEAKRYHAVNTAVFREGALHGYNTDGKGFILSLRNGGFDFSNANALVLGTGGAAKAVAIALVNSGVEVRMASRRADQLTPIHTDIAYCNWADLRHETKNTSLLVNATPLGMHGTSGDFADFAFLDALNIGATVYDLIYAPRETSLLKEAKKRGFHIMNGLPHLLYQAALAFEIFTGHMPSLQSIGAILTDLQNL